MELASQALQASKYEDWYWKVQLGKCYFRLGMFRDSEKMFKVIRNLNFFLVVLEPILIHLLS